MQILSKEHRSATPVEALDSQTMPSDVHNQQLQLQLANAEARVSAAENQASALSARYGRTARRSARFLTPSVQI
jgi:hypothetical protein